MKRVSLDQYIREVNALPGEIEEACVRGLRQTALRGVGHVVESIQEAEAVSSGELIQSVNQKRIPRGALLFVDAPHAPMVEHGTRPHWPPPGPIFEWVMRKGLAGDEQEGLDITFAIQRTIATFGTEPRHYFQRAMRTVNRDADEYIRAELKRL